MSSLPQPPPFPPVPADFGDPISFAAAMLEAWRPISRNFDDRGALTASLHMGWINQWYASHGDRIRLALQATSGLPSDELRRTIELGGLREAILDLRRRKAMIEFRDLQIAALRAGLERITQAKRGMRDLAPEDAMDRLILIAYQTLDDGPAFEQAPGGRGAAAEPGSSEAGVALDGSGVQEAITPAAPAPDASEAPESSRDTGGRDASFSHAAADSPAKWAPLLQGMVVMTASKFMAMVAVRSLSSKDGEAYPSDGRQYLPNQPIDIQGALPTNIPHVAWREFGAMP